MQVAVVRPNGRKGGSGGGDRGAHEAGRRGAWATAAETKNRPYQHPSCVVGESRIMSDPGAVAAGCVLFAEWALSGRVVLPYPPPPAAKMGRGVAETGDT